MVDLTPEQERMHALLNSMLIQAGRLALATTPDEYRVHVSAIQSISREMAKIAGVESDIMDLIRRGIGWAAGPVRRRGIELGVI